MPRSRLLPLCACLMLAACASHATPEDAQMANALCGQGKTLLASGKTTDARDVYASATHRDEDNARAWNGLGVSLELLGKKNEAEDAYKRAIDLAPKDPTAVNNLAHLYLTTGNAEDAMRLLQPHENDADASPTMRQNLAAAQKAVDADAGMESYADLGSFPTEGMAQAHLNEARGLLDDDAEGLTFSVEPVVKIAGGTPMFEAKVTGRKPQDICDDLNPKAFPCVPQGK